MAEEEKTGEAADSRGWLDRRFPLTSTWKAYFSEYYVPKNLNAWYLFGSLALLVLAIQIVTGIFLAMHYKPDAERAFESVETIMRDVPWGWLVRTMHSTGASMFFVVIYLHMLRGLLYGSHRKPRELVWVFGMMIFLCLMAEAFFGYLLPWGQMSYWGAQVIVNLFSAIPCIGPDLALWIRGDYVVSDATLNRFFSFHVIAVPLLLAGLAFLHVVALHQVGSNNPDGIDVKQGPKDRHGRPLDAVPFHPYYTVRDLMGVAAFLLVFAAIVFFAPDMGGYFLEHDNFLPADALKTPPHIAPLWYFAPFYSMLRATTNGFTWVLAGAAVLGALALFVKGRLRGWVRVALPLLLLVIAGLLRHADAKAWGVAVLGGSVVLLFFLPWLDRSPVRSIRYRPAWHKGLYALFIADFLVLGFLGTQPPGEACNLAAQAGTLVYLGFFLLMPVWSRLGAFKLVPGRVIFRPR
jgi:ubiquinol-cytochrome c reductase cytochrome b subunit